MVRVFTLVLLFSVTSVHTESRLSDFAQGACTVGVAVLGIAGIAKLVDWCLSETPAQLLSRADSQWTNIHMQYDEIICYFEHYCGITSLSPAVSKTILNTVSEPTLYGLGEKIWYMNIDQDLYRSQLRHACSTMRSLNKQLNEYIYKLNAEDLNLRLLRNKMQELAMHINTYLPHLELFSHYLDRHAGYFELFWKEGKARNHYHTELYLIETERNEVLLQNRLKQCIMSRNSGYKYPFLDFVRCLESDIENVQSAVRSLKYHYLERISYAEQLLSMLSYLKSIVVTDPYYYHELCAEKQEEIERLRIRAMQAQAQADYERTLRFARRNCTAAQLGEPIPSDCNVYVEINA